MVKRVMGMGVLGFLAVLAACSSSGGSDSTGDCTTLPSCCASISDASSKATCDSVVSMGNAQLCGEAQVDFVTQGECTVASTVTAAATSGCSALSACCTSFTVTADQELCQQYMMVAGGSDTECNMYLQSFQDNGDCKASAPASSSPTSATLSGCSGLKTCCGTLTGVEQTECNEELTEADGSAELCNAELETLQDTYQVCGGTTGGDSLAGTTHSTSSSKSSSASSSGGGDSDACASLKSCCSSLSSIEATECTSIANDGESALCAESLSGYQADQLCK